jgi:hypothetical protein
MGMKDSFVLLKRVPFGKKKKNILYILDTFGKESKKDKDGNWSLYLTKITNKKMISKTFDAKRPVPQCNDNN